MILSKTGGIIAVASKRGAKPLLHIGEIPVIQRIVLTYQQVGIFPIVVVSGTEEAEVKKQLSKYGVIFLQDEKAEQLEMLEAVRIGLGYLNGKCERVLFTPVNVPMFTPMTVSALLDTDGEIVSPVYQGKGGHPVLLSDNIIPQIISYDGPDGLRGALGCCDARRIRVEVPDRGILTNVHNEDELRTQLEEHNSSILHPVLHLRLEHEIPFFDDRLKLLLFLLADTGNMRISCAFSGIAHSKAWDMINKLEQTLNCRIVERSRGGSNGGSTRLTEAGLEFYYSFARFEASVYQFAQEEFKKQFSL